MYVQQQYPVSLSVMYHYKQYKQVISKYQAEHTQTSPLTLLPFQHYLSIPSPHSVARRL